jgi:hypothetical protein
VAVDRDVDCDRVDVVSKTTLYNVTELSRLTYRHGHYGGWEGQITRPPRATEYKGWHNEYFNQKIDFLHSRDYKLLIKIT